MKVVIFCGGYGTRLREETEFRPKPMVPIGGKPILWHIMKFYATQGHKDFILCLGYKGESIKDFFRNYHWNMSDITLRLGSTPEIQYHTNHDEEDWRVTLIDTGETTMTGGRLRRVLPFIEEDDFLLTYGDGICNSNINDTIRFHQTHARTGTVTAVHPSGRFGEMVLQGDSVKTFNEKPEKERVFISGGFFVLNKKIRNYINEDDQCVFEQAVLPILAEKGDLSVYRHNGFWQCMDTYREQMILEELWRSGKAPWKIW